MPKVLSHSLPTKGKKHPPQLLDTLSQLRKVNPKAALSEGYTRNQISLQKRSGRKAMTNAMLSKLLDLKSPLHVSYKFAYKCNSAIFQEGDKLKTLYCNQRFCLVCNSIRTGKLINGYASEIQALDNPYFVTLTVKNVKAYKLKQTIEEMQKDFRRSMDKLKKRGIVLKGIRKVEVTFNEITREYHPHFHCIIEGCRPSFTLVSDWIKRHPEQATYKGQDLRYADKETPNELFKYFTKMLTKSGQFLAPEMDIVFRAMKGKRVFQPFGGIKKQSEEVETNETTVIDWLPEGLENWVYDNAGKYSDWYNASGEPLANGTLTDKQVHLINKIIA
jgi:hypothetical protein|tara:strand:- start:988 stop:1983 length:996 start_codon:yes stop_codon:yes gene_type:complete